MINSANFFNDFIKEHKRLTDLEELKLLRLFRYGYDTQQQLLREKERIFARLASPDLPQLEYTRLNRELNEVQELIKNDTLIHSIERHRNKLIEHNLKLVLKMANSYKDKGLETEDLIQEGVLGFIRAIEKFDPNEGVKLGTYSTWWIRQRITRALSNKARIIRLPVHLATLTGTILSYVKKNSIDLNYDSVPLVAQGMNLSEEKVRLALMHVLGFYPINQVVAFEGFSSDEEEETPDSYSMMTGTHTTQQDEFSMDYEAYLVYMNSVISGLSDLDKKVLTWKYGWEGLMPLTFNNIEENLKMQGHTDYSTRIYLQDAVTNLTQLLLDNLE